MEDPQTQGKVRGRYVLATALLMCACGDPPLVEKVTDFSDRAGQYTVSTFRSDARGWVSYSVYLPPDWSEVGTQGYPLILFLHGQGGDENTFAEHVDPTTLNRWIDEGQVPPFVLIAPRGHLEPDEVHWTDRGNVRLLTSGGSGGIRAMAEANFRAGGSRGPTSVHGQSRGATGALDLIFSRPESFASVGVTSFVSDYALARLKKTVLHNADLLRGSDLRLRITIGARDPYVTQRGRTGSSDLHTFLQDLGISHQYEVIPEAGHHFGELWQTLLPEGESAGLRDLRFHAASWSGAEIGR